MDTQSDVIQLRRGASEPANDQLDTAGRTILQLIHRAAGVAEENSRHALEMAQKLSHDLRAAEDRVASSSRFRSISRIACVPKIILGLTSSEITRERSDPAAQAGNCPLRHLTQIGLELAKRHLDRVQIRGILRQITKDGATRFNRFAHACCLVCRKVVHDHGVVTPQSWSQWCST